MSYAIFTPIYGIPLINKSGKDSENILSEEMSRLLESETPGFIMEYGSSESSIAFGIKIGKEFNECYNHVELSELVLMVNQKQTDKFDKLYNSLSEEIKEEMKVFGKPRIFYLCSSS